MVRTSLARLLGVLLAAFASLSCNSGQSPTEPAPFTPLLYSVTVRASTCSCASSVVFRLADGTERAAQCAETTTFTFSQSAFPLQVVVGALTPLSFTINLPAGSSSSVSFALLCNADGAPSVAPGP